MGIPSGDDATADRTLPPDDGDEKRRILNRLRRLEGQVRGLQRMVEEDRSCHEVLTLLSGVRSALDATGDAVLARYLERCSTELDEGGTDVDRLIAAVRLARG